METNSAKASFVRELRRALNHLYDPAALRNSPLAGLFGVAQREDTVFALRRILNEAIESLKPDNSVPPGSKAWRVYQILYYRYTEQFTQCEVATDLALSIRQLRRQEKIALQVLTDYLWIRYDLEHKTHLLSTLPSQAGDDTAPMNADVPSREQELEWLKRSVPSESADLAEVLQGTLNIIDPLVQASRMHVECTVPDNLPPLSVHLTTMRQALLNTITTLIRSVPGGRVRIEAEDLAREMCIRLHATSRSGTSGPPGPNGMESLEMARQLVQLSGGSLEVTPSAGRGKPFTVELTLPAAEQIVVLVIDDNVDTLQLFQRYLSGSRYRFVGISDPEKVLTLAEQMHPSIIVLDVMLPGVDGWELLGRLREHPVTSGAPIIVCTILPQRELAMLLGAAEFIRKQVSRRTLLSALDRLFDRSPRESS